MSSIIFTTILDFNYKVPKLLTLFSVIPITLPFDCWEMLVTTRKLFFQTGFMEGKAVLAAAGEEMMPGVKFGL
jgi:hypothetical protein